MQVGPGRHPLCGALEDLELLDVSTQRGGDLTPVEPVPINPIRLSGNVTE
jgi:hypothetical protein